MHDFERNMQKFNEEMNKMQMNLQTEMNKMNQEIKNNMNVLEEEFKYIKNLTFADLAISYKSLNDHYNFGGCDCKNEKCTCCAFVEIEKINLTQPSNKNKFYLMDLSFDSLLDKFIFFFKFKVCFQLNMTNQQIKVEAKKIASKEFVTLAKTISSDFYI